MVASKAANPCNFHYYLIKFEKSALLLVLTEKVVED